MGVCKLQEFFSENDRIYADYSWNYIVDLEYKSKAFPLRRVYLVQEVYTFSIHLEDVRDNRLFRKKSYLFSNKGRLDISTSVVYDPSLSDFEIMRANYM